jgi:molybdopterin-guanine dinucleotide biosynthesis protein A
MGADKRRLSIDGQSLVSRAVRTAQAVSDDVMVVVAPDRHVDERLLRGLTWRQVVDRHAGAGPLAGLEAALAAAVHPVVVALPVDAPALTPALLRLLIERTLASGKSGGLFMSDRGPQPLPCVLRQSALPILGDLLEAGERRLAVVPRFVAMAMIDEADWRTCDPDAQWLTNINRPADLAAFQPEAVDRP